MRIVSADEVNADEVVRFSLSDSSFDLAQFQC